MQTAFDIHNLTRQEKIKVMEALWEDLSKDEENFDSPEWHGDALRQTEIQYKSGELDVVDWDNAKKDLRNKFERK